MAKARRPRTSNNADSIQDDFIEQVAHEPMKRPKMTELAPYAPQPSDILLQETSGERHIISVGELKEIARIEAQETVKSLLDLTPVAELIQETPRYFISASITYYRDGYQTIAVSGVRQLAVEDLDHIEIKVLELFAAQIRYAGEKEWPGLPDNHVIIIQNINRL